MGIECVMEQVLQSITSLSITAEDQLGLIRQSLTCRQNSEKRTRILHQIKAGTARNEHL